jgi:ribosome-associated translation inhibitor RaiA
MTSECKNKFIKILDTIIPVDKIFVIRKNLDIMQIEVELSTNNNETKTIYIRGDLSSLNTAFDIALSQLNKS